MPWLTDQTEPLLGYLIIPNLKEEAEDTKEGGLVEELDQTDFTIVMRQDILLEIVPSRDDLGVLIVELIPMLQKNIQT